MLETLGLLVAGGAAAGGYLKSRSFVRRRLRFVDEVQSPATPIIAGLGAWGVALPVVALLPVIGAGTAIVFGAAVGLGTRAGARDIADPLR